MTAAEIAETLQMPLSTVSVVLKREGIGRLGRIGLERPRRYERSRPGELVHIDVKKLGRIRGVGHRISGHRASQGKTRINGRITGVAGWEYVHAAVDDYSRLAYAEVLLDERASTAAGFLARAVAFFARYGIKVERVLTDNGSCYRAVLHALACRRLGIRHLRTRPHRPSIFEERLYDRVFIGDRDPNIEARTALRLDASFPEFLNQRVTAECVYI